MTKEELESKISNLRHRAWDVWTSAHQLPRQLGLDDSCFFACGGIKSHILKVTNNLKNLERILSEHCITEEEDENNSTN